MEDKKIILCSRDLALDENKIILAKLKGKIILGEMKSGEELNFLAEGLGTWTAYCNHRNTVFIVFYTLGTDPLKPVHFLMALEEALESSIRNYQCSDTTLTEIKNKLSEFLEELIRLYSEFNTKIDIDLEVKRLRKKYFIRSIKSLSFIRKVSKDY